MKDFGDCRSVAGRRRGRVVHVSRRVQRSPCPSPLTSTMATPGRPRLSAIPTPGRGSGIPTPGTRSRSASTNAGPYATHTPTDADYVSRSLADAIKANNPAQHRPSPLLPPARPADVTTGGPPRPSSVASSVSSVSASQPIQRSKTPTSRPKSRTSDVFTRSHSRAGSRSFEVGDTVRYFPVAPFPTPAHPSQNSIFGL